MAELRPIIYQKELEKCIFPDNSFYKHSVQNSGVADGCDTCEKPVQKAISKAKEGEPDSYPLSITKVEDDKRTFTVSKIYAEPILITNDSQILTNYNIRATKQEQQANEINTRAADRCAYNWGATKKSNILMTTGANRATNVVGLTGERKAASKADMLALYNIMLRMQFAGGKWFGLITPDFHTDLLSIPEFVDYEKTGNTTKLADGAVGRLFGCEFFTRSTEANHTGLIYTSAATPVRKAVGIAIAVTDLAANLFWNDKAVCTAEGKLAVAINEKAPGYLGGTIIESWVRFGADKARDDERGIITILEAPSA